jgi:hypothetical protein
MQKPILLTFVLLASFTLQVAEAGTSVKHPKVVFDGSIRDTLGFFTPHQSGNGRSSNTESNPFRMNKFRAYWLT